MPGNAAYYNNIHFMYAKYKGTCPECEKEIAPMDPIVYMSEFRTSLHFNCFYHGPVISYADPLLHPKSKIVIDPQFSFKTQFMILLYRLKKAKNPKPKE